MFLKSVAFLVSKTKLFAIEVAAIIASGNLVLYCCLIAMVWLIISLPIWV